MYALVSDSISTDYATCTKPTVDNGSVSPSDATIVEDASYTASCDTGYTMSGTATMTCMEDETFSSTPTCAGSEKNEFQNQTLN